MTAGQGSDQEAGWQLAGTELAAGRASLEAGGQLTGPKLATGWEAEGKTDLNVINLAISELLSSPNLGYFSIPARATTYLEM